MILEFKIKNYRSYRDEVVFSMLADSSKQKKQNVSDVAVSNQHSQVRTLKTAIIYGANASGKTNVVRALYFLVQYILKKPTVDQPISFYDPYLFDKSYAKKPMEIELTFIGPSYFKYIYSIKLNSTEVLAEELSYYPGTQRALLFKREPYNPAKTIQIGKLGASRKNKEISIFKNQLLLSKFGDDEPDETLSEIYLHFKKYSVYNAVSTFVMDDLFAKVNADVNANPNLKAKLERLIAAADTKVKGILLEDNSYTAPLLQKGMSADYKKNEFTLYGIHEMFHLDVKVKDTYNLSMRQESKGTRTFYILAGTILNVLETGGVMVVDELDTSLHPFITKLIVMLFHSEKTNPKGAQLIFTTHDVSLLDRDLVRKDQIWFAEKNEMGVTDLYSLQDFDGLREDTPFEKWYLAGKFGGLPNVKSVESIFDGIDEN